MPRGGKDGSLSPSLFIRCALSLPSSLSSDLLHALFRLHDSYRSLIRRLHPSRFVVSSFRSQHLVFTVNISWSSLSLGVIPHRQSCRRASVPSHLLHNQQINHQIQIVSYSSFSFFPDLPLVLVLTCLWFPSFACSRRWSSAQRVPPFRFRSHHRLIHHLSELPKSFLLDLNPVPLTISVWGR